MVKHTIPAAPASTSQEHQAIYKILVWREVHGLDPEDPEDNDRLPRKEYAPSEKVLEGWKMQAEAVAAWEKNPSDKALKTAKDRVTKMAGQRYDNWKDQTARYRLDTDDHLRMMYVSNKKENERKAVGNRGKRGCIGPPEAAKDYPPRLVYTSTQQELDAAKVMAAEEPVPPVKPKKKKNGEGPLRKKKEAVIRSSPASPTPSPVVSASRRKRVAVIDDDSPQQSVEKSAEHSGAKLTPPPSKKRRQNAQPSTPPICDGDCAAGRKLKQLEANLYVKLLQPPPPPPVPEDNPVPPMNSPQPPAPEDIPLPPPMNNPLPPGPEDKPPPEDHPLPLCPEDKPTPPPEDSPLPPGPEDKPTPPPEDRPLPPGPESIPLPPPMNNPLPPGPESNPAPPLTAENTNTSMLQSPDLSVYAALEEVATAKQKEDWEPTFLDGVIAARPITTKPKSTKQSKPKSTKQSKPKAAKQSKPKPAKQSKPKKHFKDDKGDKCTECGMYILMCISKGGH